MQNVRLCSLGFYRCQDCTAEERETRMVVRLAVNQIPVIIGVVFNEDVIDSLRLIAEGSATVILPFERHFHFFSQREFLLVFLWDQTVFRQDDRHFTANFHQRFRQGTHYICQAPRFYKRHTFCGRHYNFHLTSSFKIRSPLRSTIGSSAVPLSTVPASIKTFLSAMT